MWGAAPRTIVCEATGVLLLLLLLLLLTSDVLESAIARMNSVDGDSINMTNDMRKTVRSEMKEKGER